MRREGAEQILNYFLFEDVYNNRMGPYEGTHEITFVDDHFAVFHRESGAIHTFKVVFEPSDLPINVWNREFESQEWLFLEKEDDDED